MKTIKDMAMELCYAGPFWQAANTVDKDSPTGYRLPLAADVEAHLAPMIQPVIEQREALRLACMELLSWCDVERGEPHKENAVRIAREALAKVEGSV